MHNTGRKIAIIGGGIGGLTAALAFARQDAKVTVYEQAEALTEVGAGLQITPNGMRALHALQLQRALDVTGIAAEAVVPTDALSGQAITRFDLSRQTPRYQFFHRAALLDVLARACQAEHVEIKLGVRVSVLAPSGRAVVDGQELAADLVVGADGLHSVVRQAMNKPEKPFFTGQVAWRALIKTTEAPPEARIWMAPGRHVVTYPLPFNKLNIVAVQERAAWADEGWNHADDPANLQAAFADCAPELRAILDQVAQVNLWGLFRHPVAEHWHLDRAAILGDAAHPTLPFLAQGANLAIEDAYVLARLCNENADLSHALHDYQAMRRPRVLKAINAANANARNYHLSGLQRRVAHIGLKAMGCVGGSLLWR